MKLYSAIINKLPNTRFYELNSHLFCIGEFISSGGMSSALIRLYHRNTFISIVNSHAHGMWDCITIKEYDVPDGTVVSARDIFS